MCNSHSLSFMVMPAECHFGTHVGGLAQEEGHLSFLELMEGKSSLREMKGGEVEGEKKNSLVHLTCSALWEEQ